MAVTIKDVAREAGVSVATVSRVLSGRNRVSDGTRQVVERACKKLGYQPHAAAAALRSGSSRSIGILIPDITNPYFPAVVQTVEHELAQAAIDVLFCDADNDVALEARRLETLLRRRVDAMLVCPVDATGSATALQAASERVRVLQLDRLAIEDADYLGVDQVAGMTQIVDHLTSCGVDDVVFVGDHAGISSIRERARAFETVCRARGITTRPPAPLSPDMASGRAFTRDLLAQGDPPSALVCANDLLAFGVLMELREAGVRCPEDILVTGYDDVPAAELMGLTTVAQPLAELGREAARLLQQDTTATRHLRLSPTLILRGTAPARRSSR